MGAAEPHGTPIAARAGCGGCVMPLLMALLALGLTVGVYYFGDIHGTQMLHADDETRFDPIAALPYATRLADAPKFLQMTATYVRSDGTMDLTADYDPHVLYQWIGDTVQSDSRPLGAGGGGTQHEIVSVRATDFGFRHTGSGPAGEQYYELNLGLRRWEGTTSGLQPAAPPACKLARLWASAIERGAPPDAVAVIHYNLHGYNFRIDGTGFQMNFGADCKPR